MHMRGEGQLSRGHGSVPLLRRRRIVHESDSPQLYLMRINYCKVKLPRMSQSRRCGTPRRLGRRSYAAKAFIKLCGLCSKVVRLIFSGATLLAKSEMMDVLLSIVIAILTLTMLSSLLVWIIHLDKKVSIPAESLI